VLSCPKVITVSERIHLPTSFRQKSSTIHPFLARYIIYISHLCYDVSVRLSVRLSVTEVHWHIVANLGFKFRSKFTAYCGRGEG